MKMKFGMGSHGIARVLAALTLAVLMSGCDNEDSDSGPEQNEGPRANHAEIERDHRVSVDHHIICKHAMYVGEIPLDEEPVVAQASKSKRPDAHGIQKVIIKGSSTETAWQSSRSVPAPPPGWEYQR